MSSTERKTNTPIGKPSTTIERLTTIWKFIFSDEIKLEFFKAVTVSLLSYGCTTWIFKKHPDKKLDENYTRILHDLSNSICMVIYHQSY